MMRRFWISASVLALTLTLSLANGWFLGHITGGVIERLCLAQVLAESGDWASALAETQSAQQDWESAADYLYITLRHTETDEISAGFREVAELLEWQEEAEYTSANAELVEEIRLLAEMEQFSLRNLL